MKTLHATTKTKWSQINTLIFFKKTVKKKKFSGFLRLLQDVGGDVIVMTSD